MTASSVKAPAPADIAARNEALNLRRSYCVRAPAGSGKTGLLICRMLAALAEVDQPEQVVAITFTRKAAAEIRERLMLALQSAEQVPSDEFGAQVHGLALSALRNSRQRGWMLEQNPQRLRALTIDGLNREIARQMPIISGLGAPLTPSDDAGELYREALLEALALHEDSSVPEATRDAIGRVLRWSQNRLENLLESLIPLLAQREQWAAALADCSSERIQHQGQNLLDLWIRNSLQSIDKKLARTPRNDWLQILQSLGVDDSSPWHPLTQLTEWPGCNPNALPHWQCLAQSLLTKSGEWRKPGGLNKRTGFPAGDSTKQAKSVLPEFIPSEEYRQSLRNDLELLLRLPGEYSLENATAASDILSVLQLALAHLKLLFARRGYCDHTEVALAARQALRDESSGAAAKADATIRHILVDEMQDTSAGQIALLEHLTSDWLPGDGRSLFLVGDPQQSIYLFRQARVELFNSLLQPGAALGSIPLHPLQLSHNFRSDSALVEWTNKVMSGVFRDQGSPIAFAPSTTFGPGPDKTAAADAVRLLRPTDVTHEASLVRDAIKEILLKDPAARIGVLARNRNHLTALAASLREAQLTFSGIELEALVHTPAIRNYLAIVRVLHQPEDDFASLRLLRSPGVGLSWAECDLLVTATPDWRWSDRLRHELPSSVSLPQVGGLRAALLAAESTWHQSGDLPLAARQLFFALHLQHSLNNAERRDVQRFEAHLRAACPNGPLADEAAFSRALNRIWAETRPSQIELMTIHKSKGLEFDHVFILGMGRSGSGGTDPLLRWHPEANAQALALHQRTGTTTDDEKPDLYRWLASLQSDAEHAERLRLLYVGVTRARSGLQMFLTGTAYRGSLGHAIKTALDWPEPEADESSQPASARTEDTDLVEVIHPRFAQGFQPALARGVVQPKWLYASAPSQVSPGTRLSAHDTGRLEATLVGSSVHEALERVSYRGVSDWLDNREVWLRSLRAGLARRGLPSHRQNDAIERISTLLDRALSGQGRWLVAAHPWARSEYAVNGRLDGHIVQGVIDRCFETQDGELWIVDYKSNTPPCDRHASEWHASLAEEYGTQLSRYASLLQSLRQKPARRLLYLLHTDELLELTDNGPFILKHSA